jgi:hypothetical protein
MIVETIGIYDKKIEAMADYGRYPKLDYETFTSQETPGKKRSRKKKQIVSTATSRKTPGKKRKVSELDSSKSAKPIVSSEGPKGSGIPLQPPDATHGSATEPDIFADSMAELRAEYDKMSTRNHFLKNIMCTDATRRSEDESGIILCGHYPNG